MLGVVKWFNEAKGFGFIIPRDGSEDLFVHYSDIKSEEKFKTLGEGQTVEYDEAQTHKGMQATNVIVIHG